MWRIMTCATTLLIGTGATAAWGQDRVSIGGSAYAIVGDPGNRDTNDEEIPDFPGTRIGGVDYAFWLAMKEVTVEQHLGFVEAYYPFYVKNTGDVFASPAFTGRSIFAGSGEVLVIPGHALDEPTEMSWEYAARYINWLHHGKVIEEWAFETGVYDTSTFVQDDDGSWQHQPARNPGARFFMPTLDEWTKAGYWDPEKNDGAGGYWRFPNGSDEEPRPGLPGDGGERNAGDPDVFPLGVGSYPDVRSPWGMLDMAGGQSELTETARRASHLRLRRLCGSWYAFDVFGYPYSADQVGFATEIPATFVAEGLRLGVPSGFHPADLNHDDRVDFFDVSFYIQLYLAGDERADLRSDGTLDLDDVRVFLGLMSGLGVVQ